MYFPLLAQTNQRRTEAHLKTTKTILDFNVVMSVSYWLLLHCIRTNIFTNNFSTCILLLLSICQTKLNEFLFRLPLFYLHPLSVPKPPKASYRINLNIISCLSTRTKPCRKNDNLMVLIVKSVCLFAFFIELIYGFCLKQSINK